MGRTDADGLNSDKTMVIDNPRHPHHCVIYRIVGETSFSDGEKLVIYEGKCRKYTTRGARTTAVTTTSQYTLSVPAVVKAMTGDIVEVDDKIGHFVGNVTEVNAGNLGTDIYWNNAKV